MRLQMVAALLFCALPLFSAVSALHFSDAELAAIKQRFGTQAINRITDFGVKMRQFRSLERDAQLNRVNTYLNGYLPEYDTIINKNEDYWSTPKEFLAVGYGDCEEYAIAKYFVLRELGFDTKRLCLGIVRDRYSGGYHMVLLYFKEAGRSPLVLDNLSFRILPLSERSDLMQQYCFNESGLFRVGPQGERTPLQGREAKFEGLMKRIGAGR